MTPSLSFVLGTRPEIIKLSPIIRLCEQRDISFSIIHTGQHYSDDLDSMFFEHLGLPSPAHNLEVGSSSHGKQTGEMIAGIESVLVDEQPAVVLVQGDTNSVLAGTIAASKMGDLRIGHVEAGLRSFDRDMPEEINRRLADHAADYLFPPTETAREKLLSENLEDQCIRVTGNTIVDAVNQNVEIAHERSTVLSDLDVPNRFALLTAHRAENVDDQDRFNTLLRSVARAARAVDFQVVYPIHPRAEKRLSEYNIRVPEEISIVEPQSFFDFLVLEDEATIVLTDSGGVQEESCILQTPCVTLRDNTERPETVEVGANRVVGVQPENVVQEVKEMLQSPHDWENPFGDGKAAKRILDTIGYK